MGNCCNARSYLTDNDAENIIRESILLLKSRNFDLEEIDYLLTREIGVSLLEIKDNMGKWVSKEKYQMIVQNYFINNSVSEFRECQKSVSLSYSDVSKKKVKINSSNYNFLLWIIANSKNAESKKVKISFFETVITEAYNMITLSTLNSFLENYLDIILFKITHNFKDCDLIFDKNLEEQLSTLTNNIYTTEKIQSYRQMLLKRMVDLIISKNSSLAEKDLSNEFIKPRMFYRFLKENSFLLDCCELRDNFFKRHSNIYV